jgi:hypothetical protein
MSNILFLLHFSSTDLGLEYLFLLERKKITLYLACVSDV